MICEKYEIVSNQSKLSSLDNMKNHKTPVWSLLYLQVKVVSASHLAAHSAAVLTLYILFTGVNINTPSVLLYACRPCVNTPVTSVMYGIDRKWNKWINLTIN